MPDDQRPIVAGNMTSARMEAAEVSFVPPPRTIADILEKLDRELAARKPGADVAALAGSLQSATGDVQSTTDGPSPPGPDNRRSSSSESSAKVEQDNATSISSAEQLRRANEARLRAQRLRTEGRIAEHLAATREALDLATRANHRNVGWFMTEASSAEFDFGSPEQGMALQLRAVDAATGPVDALNFAATAARRLAAARRIDEARAMFNRAEAFRRIARSARDVGLWEPMYAWHIDRAQAYIHQAVGDLPGVEAAWRRAVANAETMHARARAGLGSNPNRFVNDATFSQAELARILNEQSRFVEAEIFARRSLQTVLEAHGPYHPTTIFRMEALYSVLLAQGRFAEAEDLASRSLAIQGAMRFAATSPATLRARGLIAAALLWRGKYGEALAQYRTMLEQLRNDQRLAETHVTGTRNYGVALLMTGDARTARHVLDRVVQTESARFGERAYGPAVTRGFRAIAVARTGDPRRAVQELGEIAPILERGPSGDAASADASRAGANEVRRALIEEAVHLLADVAAGGTAPPGSDPLDLAFRLADLARGMSVQGAVAQMGTRAFASDPNLEMAIRQEQDATRQIDAIRGMLADAAGRPSGNRDARAEARLARQVEALEADRHRLNEDLGRRFPQYEQLRKPRLPSLADTAAALKPGEALVSFFVGRARSYVWALRQGQSPRFAIIPAGEAALAREIAALRSALDPKATTLEEIPVFDAARAHRLYATLLGPVEPALSGARAATMIPYGPLSQLPFSVLVARSPTAIQPSQGQPKFAEYRNVPWLVRDLAISQLPAVTAFRMLRQLPAPTTQRLAFAGFGDPTFSAAQTTAQANFRSVPSASMRGVPLVRRSAAIPRSAPISIGHGDLQPLPDTGDEVLSVARALAADTTRDVFLGLRATERAVRSADLARRRVVMFATHGLVPGDLDGLTQPALALTSPSLADGDGDGLLTMEEILRLRLDADWVVLSACNTAAGEGEGAEAISGLGRAFFYAGARALLVTSWPVETTSARLLTTDVFARQTADPSLDRASALRQAMLGLIDSQAEGGAFAYAHPIFWAPFILVGDSG